MIAAAPAVEVPLMRSGNTSMITNIQLLRAAAAMAIVFYHTGYLLGHGVHTDFQGVAVFFVISGFIIPRVGYRGSREFVIHRFIRIVPIYWIATLADLSWFTAPGKARIALTALFAAAAFVPEKLIQNFFKTPSKARWMARAFGIGLLIFLVDFFVRGLKGVPGQTRILMLKSLAFIPARDINGDLHPYLGPGWTLNMEMYFYALFAVGLSIHKRLAPLLVAVVLAVLQYLHQAGIWTGIYAEFYTHDYIRYFVYGMGLYYVYGAAEKIPATVRANRAVSAIAVVSAAVVAGLFVCMKILPFPFSLPCPPVVLVAAALVCHLVGARITATWILVLGNASYVLYLFHIFFLETIRPFLQIDTTIGMLAVLIVSAAAAVAIHRYGEAPLLAFLRRRSDAGRGVILAQKKG